MANIHDRLVSAIQSLLHISTGPNLDEFASSYTDTLDKYSTGLLGDGITLLPDDLADTIDVVCDTLLQLSVADGDVSQRLKDDLDIVKTQNLPEQNQHIVLPSAAFAHSDAPTSRGSSPTSPSSSRASSPTPSRRASPWHSCPTAVAQQPFADTTHMAVVAEKAYEASSAALPTPSVLSSRVRVPPSLTSTEPVTDPANVAGPSSRSPSPSPSTDTLPPTPRTPTPSPAYIQPILEHFVVNPYNPYPHKSFLLHVASSTSTSEKDVNTYLRSLRSKLGWNRIQKRYFPKPQWTQWQMIAWLEGLWRFEHSREPSFDEWDKYRGPDGLGRKMKGLDAELVVVVHELKNMAERRQGPTEVAKVLDQVNWEEFVEKKNLKRKAEEDEASRQRVVSESTHKRARSGSEEAQSKKRSRSESPESDDGTPPPSKRHCSLPTMSLSTPPEITHWKTSAWVPPAQVSLNTFNYDRYAVPVLVDDESEDGSEGGSVGPSTPETADHVALPSWDFSSYDSQPQPATLNVSTLPDASFPELLNLDLFSPAYMSAPTDKNLPSVTPAMDHYIPIQPLIDDLPFDFDSQSWSFHYDDLNLDLGVDWNSIGIEGA